VAEVPAVGTLEVLPDGYGFLRKRETGYRSLPDDPYVAQSLIERFGLSTGNEIEGISHGSNKGQTRFHLKEITSVNNTCPDDSRLRTAFDELTPEHPSKRLWLECDRDISMRVVDLIAPIGKGQRGLIVAPPRAGKTVLLQKLVNSVLVNHPECHVIILLIDERPEEVTEVRDTVRGTNCEVISSTFDQTPSNHVRVARIALGRAKGLVESGRDVVVFLDSITRLTRAHNSLTPNGCKITTGGIAMEALEAPKRFFGGARQCREAGSLTILATALIDTGSRMDDFIFEEFKGTGNMEIHLSRRLAGQQIWPAIDILLSGTRREELLSHIDEVRGVRLLRKVLGQTSPEEGMQRLISRLGKTNSNAEFLCTIPQD
jgi:transcription termination factor Rho